MSQHDTSLTLLDELCRSPDDESWERLVSLYSPLLRSWLRRYDVQDSDADDLVQDVLMVVMKELPSFRHNKQPGAFRTWLRRIVVNRLRNFWRARGREAKGSGDTQVMQRINELEDERSQMSRVWDREHDQHLTRRLLDDIEPRFAENTRRAFRLLVLDGASADNVAAELGMSLNAVFTAKSRVLRELRRLGKGLID